MSRLFVHNYNLTAQIGWSMVPAVQFRFQSSNAISRMGCGFAFVYDKCLP